MSALEGKLSMLDLRINNMVYSEQKCFSWRSSANTHTLVPLPYVQTDHRPYKDSLLGHWTDRPASYTSICAHRSVMYQLSATTKGNIPLRKTTNTLTLKNNNDKRHISAQFIISASVLWLFQHTPMQSQSSLGRKQASRSEIKNRYFGCLQSRILRHLN